MARVNLGVSVQAWDKAAAKAHRKSSAPAGPARSVRTYIEFPEWLHLHAELFFWVLLASAAGCNLDHPGEAPELGKLYFPTAVAISAGQQGHPARYLFVANSNFDLAYNAGSLQAFDLEALDERIAGCDAEPCTIPNADLLRGEVRIGSYATGITVSATGDRIYVPTRSNSALTWIDLRPQRGDDGILDCGQGGDLWCDNDHVRDERTLTIDRGDEDEQRVAVPVEPVGAITGPMSDFDSEAGDGEHYVMVAYRIGAVSLYLDGPGRAVGPKLIGVLDGIRERIAGIAYDPVTAFAYLTSSDVSGVIQAKALDRIGVRYAGEHSVIYDAGPVWLTGVSFDRDTRDLDFDAESLPGKALVVARVPSSLIVAETEPDRGDLNWTTASAVVEVGSGASRVAVGRIGGNHKLFAFVSCFSSRELFVVDIRLGEPVAVVRGFSGPFDLVLDRWRQRLYLADFRSSTIRIVDLRPLVCDPDDEDTACDSAVAASGAELPCRCLDDRELRITATVGEPNLPTELL